MGTGVGLAEGRATDLRVASRHGALPATSARVMVTYLRHYRLHAASNCRNGRVPGAINAVSAHPPSSLFRIALLAPGPRQVGGTLLFSAVRFLQESRLPVSAVETDSCELR